MNTSRSLVSVVVACDEPAPNLSNALDGASAHDADVEAIVVAPGVGVPGSAPDEVKFIRQDRAGIAAAWNRGLEASAGTFVIFLDSNDLLLPGAVDAGVRALSANPECAIAYGRWGIIGANGELRQVSDVPTVRSGHFAALLRTNLIWVPATAIFRREPLVEAGGFDETIDSAADYDLYLRIARTYRIHDHGHLVAGYRAEDSSAAGAARLLRDTLEVMRRNCPRLESELLSAWREGYESWQEFYGMQLADEIRRDLRSAAPWRAVGKTITLTRLAPGVIRHALREARPYRSGPAYCRK
jgi:glycosyltransferase involved in cell wall biosynthesis